VHTHRWVLKTTGVWVSGDEIRAGGDDDGIALAGIAVKVEVGRHLGPAIDEEFVALSAERFIGFLRIIVGFRVEN
jgi:hypothetical protein